jgi:hypothetical protein
MLEFHQSNIEGNIYLIENWHMFRGALSNIIVKRNFSWIKLETRK